MFQAAEDPLYKPGADLALQHKIDRTPSLEQGMTAIQKIARCVVRFPNPYGVGPHGCEPRNAGAFPCTQAFAGFAAGERRLRHDAVFETGVGWGYKRNDALQASDRQAAPNEVHESDAMRRPFQAQ